MKQVVIILFLAMGLISNAQEVLSKVKSNNNMLYDRISEAPVDGGFKMDDYWVWGSSIVKGDDGLYHMYVSRWPKELVFHTGWMVKSEIVHATSEIPEGPYKFSDIVLPARGAEYWDGRSTHNPRMMKHKDVYVLYYMGTTLPFAEISNPDTLDLSSPYATVARSNKRIGIATSKSPYGPWERRDAPILDVKPDTFYSFLTSNPAPWINEDGSVSLVFKARAYKEEFPFQGDMSLGVEIAPHFEGPYPISNNNQPIFSREVTGEVEDPFLWKDENGYHMIAKDQRGEVSGYKHSGILVHSPTGVNWSLDKDPVAYSKTIDWSNGETQTMGQLERAFGLIESGKIMHLFFATMDGPGGFNNATQSRNMVVPLRAKKISKEE